MKLPPTFKTFIAPMTLIIVCWGMNFTVIKAALSEIQPMTFRGLSTSIGAICLFGYLMVRRKSLYVPKKEWLSMVVYALITVTIFQSSATYGISLLPSGRAAILGYTMPIWAVILSVIYLKEPLTYKISFGLFFGIIGIILLILKELTAIAGSPLGIGLMIFSAMMWATATIVFKKAQFTTPLPTLAFWTLLIGSIPLLTVALIIEGLPTPLSGSVWLACLYNAIIIFIICQMAWFKVLQVAPANICSLATLGVPVVSILSGFLVLNERPNMTDIFGLILILLSLFIVLMPASRRTDLPNSSA